jgi:hypothetical protein
MGDLAGGKILDIAVHVFEQQELAQTPPALNGFFSLFH